jgi:hypothetical protein
MPCAHGGDRTSSRFPSRSCRIRGWNRQSSASGIGHTSRPAPVATTLRAELWRVGYRPIPVFNADAKVTSPGKQPLGKAWQRDARRDPPFCVTSPAVQHALNTGILADGLRALDIDIDDRELALRVRNLAIEAFGDTIIRTRKNSGRCLLPYHAAQGSPKKRVLSGCLV